MGSIYETKRHVFKHKGGAFAWEDIIPAPEIDNRSIVICDIIAVGMTSLELKDSSQPEALGSENRILNTVAGAEQGITIMGLNVVAKNGGTSIQAKTAGSGDHTITITYYIT